MGTSTFYRDLCVQTLSGAYSGGGGLGPRVIKGAPKNGEKGKERERKREEKRGKER